MAIDIITGGAGFVGSYVAEALLERGRTVRVVDNLVSGHPRNLKSCLDRPNFELIEADIRDRDALDRAFAGAERVFHLAALADIVPSIENPEAYFTTNVDGTFCVMQAARAAGASKVIYAASSSCYGIPQQYPTSESAALDPRYPYALTKLLGEQIVMHWARVYAMPVVSLRLFNVYGPRSRTAGTYGAVFGVFMGQLLNGKPLTIVGDGTQTRDFTFVTDVARAFVAAAESTVAGEIMNVATGKGVSVNRIVELLGAPETVHVPKRPGEPDQMEGDVSKIRRLIGWAPKVSIEEGVGRILEQRDYWRDAPVWTPGTIAKATDSWFRYLAPAK